MTFQINKRTTPVLQAWADVSKAPHLKIIIVNYTLNPWEFNPYGYQNLDYYLQVSMLFSVITWKIKINLLGSNWSSNNSN